MSTTVNRSPTVRTSLPTSNDTRRLYGVTTPDVRVPWQVHRCTPAPAASRRTPAAGAFSAVPSPRSSYAPDGRCLCRFAGPGVVLSERCATRRRVPYVTNRSTRDVPRTAHDEYEFFPCARALPVARGGGRLCIDDVAHSADCPRGRANGPGRGARPRRPGALLGMVRIAGGCARCSAAGSTLGVAPAGDSRHGDPGVSRRRFNRRARR